jgi:hypothetical protein
MRPEDVSCGPAAFLLPNGAPPLGVGLSDRVAAGRSMSCSGGVLGPLLGWGRGGGMVTSDLLTTDCHVMTGRTDRCPFGTMTCTQFHTQQL